MRRRTAYTGIHSWPPLTLHLAWSIWYKMRPNSLVSMVHGVDRTPTCQGSLQNAPPATLVDDHRTSPFRIASRGAGQRCEGCTAVNASAAHAGIAATNQSTQTSNLQLRTSMHLLTAFALASSATTRLMGHPLCSRRAWRRRPRFLARPGAGSGSGSRDGDLRRGCMVERLKVEGIICAR